MDFITEWLGNGLDYLCLWNYDNSQIFIVSLVVIAIVVVTIVACFVRHQRHKRKFYCYIVLQWIFLVIMGIFCEFYNERGECGVNEP